MDLGRFAFSFAQALFVVFETLTLRLPWPVKHFVLRQFPDEYAAQRVVMRSLRDRALLG